MHTESAETAKAAFAAGQYGAALEGFSAVLEQHPHRQTEQHDTSDLQESQRHLLLCNRSAVLLKLGRHAEAAEDARSAVALAPRRVKAHYRLACALQAGNNYEAALEVRGCREGPKKDGSHGC